MPVTVATPLAMLDRADVADLTAATGMERRAVEHDPSGRGVDDGRAVLVQVGLLVAEVHGHGRGRYRRVLADGISAV